MAVTTSAGQPQRANTKNSHDLATLGKAAAKSKKMAPAGAEENVLINISVSISKKTSTQFRPLIIPLCEVEIWDSSIGHIETFIVDAKMLAPVFDAEIGRVRSGGARDSPCTLSSVGMQCTSISLNPFGRARAIQEVLVRSVL